MIQTMIMLVIVVLLVMSLVEAIPFQNDSTSTSPTFLDVHNPNHDNYSTPSNITPQNQNQTKSSQQHPDDLIKVNQVVHHDFFTPSVIVIGSAGILSIVTIFCIVAYFRLRGETQTDELSSSDDESCFDAATEGDDEKLSEAELKYLSWSSTRLAREISSSSEHSSV